MKMNMDTDPTLFFCWKLDWEIALFSELAFDCYYANKKFTVFCFVFSHNNISIEIFLLYELFLHHFYWSLSDKSPQVSRILLSLLTDFNHSGVWMALIIPLISSFSSIFSKDQFKDNYYWYNRFSHVPLFFFFPSLWQDLGICLSFHFLVC